MDNNNNNIVRSRRSREECSPDRAKICMQMQQTKVKPMKKVQVVYYLSRNGQLEHPHYMEVSHLPNHRLRLRDVLDRLTVLRGKGMPSLYSWSCKRSYKNGYVWNDLTENDVIYASDGAEYVLKGSELVQGSCSERFQLPSLHAKERQLVPSQRKQLDGTRTSKFEFEDYGEEEEEESQEEYEDEEKTSSYTSSTTPHSRCSRGVSTDELEPPNKTPTTESTQHNPFPSPSIKPNKITNPYPTVSRRFEDGDPVVAESGTTRNSVLLQLISCGNLTAARPKNPNMKQEPSRGSDMVIKKSQSNLHKGVLYKTAVKVAEEEEEDVMMQHMSENHKFGKLQGEEKEYFSGSIVESMSQNRVVDDSTGLKRSNSYNEERSTNEEREKEGNGKCIPRKVSSSSTKQIKKSSY